MNTYEEFFAVNGDSLLHPTLNGEAINSITIEEMYQHFKARLLAETVTNTVD